MGAIYHQQNVFNDIDWTYLIIMGSVAGSYEHNSEPSASIMDSKIC
jgi:hypothetical protein